MWDFMKTDRISALKEANNDLDFFFRFQVSLCPHKLENMVQCFPGNFVVYGAGNGMVASKSHFSLIRLILLVITKCAYMIVPYNNLSQDIVD